MLLDEKNVSIISCNSNRPLTQKICDNLGFRLTKADVGKFSDGEICISIAESVRGKHVYVVQSICTPHVNDYLMELLIMIDALKRASAYKIVAVIPYYGYARQDRKAKPRDPISAKLVADLISVAGADRVITMDLHANQIQGYFSIPVDHLIGGPILASYFEKMDNLSDFTVVSPDLGSVTRSRNFASHLHVPLAIIDKRRPKPNEAEVMNIIGEVEGRNIILIDDIIDTAGTITNAVKALKARGAKDIYVGCTHAVLSGEACSRLSSPDIKKVITLDTIELPDEKILDNMEILSVADIFSNTIRTVQQNGSVSQLFNDF